MKLWKIKLGSITVAGEKISWIPEYENMYTKYKYENTKEEWKFQYSFDSTWPSFTDSFIIFEAIVKLYLNLCRQKAQLKTEPRTNWQDIWGDSLMLKEKRTNGHSVHARR